MDFMDFIWLISIAHTDSMHLSINCQELLHFGLQGLTLCQLYKIVKMDIQ